jgi:ADP-dependent NAD(P)H-hydrate dehydratase / NAD(P)H-hydrate epimerase
MAHRPLQVYSMSVPVVTAQQMRDIESHIFENGMPVAALMEKVGGLIANRIQSLYPFKGFPQVGILVGPGHNGGDALVVARELIFKGYGVKLYHPFERSKELTTAHAQFARSLDIPFEETVDGLESCDVLVDGLFGFGLERELTGTIAADIDRINQWSQPVVSIDIPSGLHTDTGEVLGSAIQANQTLCLGLWKLGLLQDPALPWVGQAELVDFNIPAHGIEAVLGSVPFVQRLEAAHVLAQLSLKRSPITHKYREGHLLLMGGSQQYAGSIILAGLAARASGVGMLTIAVPASLKPLVVAQLPDAIVLDCRETPTGAIAMLPTDLDLSRFDAIAYGPGVTTQSGRLLELLLDSDRVLLLDADGLNLLAQRGASVLSTRRATTILTPHRGEFQRLFPALDHLSPTMATRAAAEQCRGIVVLKGACSTIAVSTGQVWINTESTPALARGGSGDVLTGLMGGLLARAQKQGRLLEEAVQGAVWWHGQAGKRAASDRTELGVDAYTLSQSLNPTLKEFCELANGTDEFRPDRL